MGQSCWSGHCQVYLAYIRYTWQAMLWHKFHYIMKTFSHYFFKTFPYPHPIPILSKILIIWVLDVLISIPLFFLLCVQSEISLIFSSIESNFLLIPPSKTSISDSIKESLYFLLYKFYLVYFYVNYFSYHLCNICP